VVYLWLVSYKIIIEGRFMKAKILSVLMISGVSAGAYADEVKAVKKSGGAQVVDNLYGTVETRVTNFQTVNKDNGDTIRRREYRLRPKLGTKLMSEKFDISLAMPVVNKQHSAKTEKTRPEVEQNLSLFESDRLDIGISSLHYLPNNEEIYDGYVDLDVTLKRTFDRLSFAVIDTSVLFEAEANLTTKKIDANVTSRQNPEGAALAESESAAAPTPEQKETTKSLYVIPTIAVKPTAVAGLTLTLMGLFENDYTPNYIQVISEDGSSSLKDDGYQTKRSSQVRYTVKYQINPDVAIHNQLRQTFNGYLEANHKGLGLENRTGITMNLF
jgi:hypothetical protein